jgi:WD40 repeat protein
MHEWPLTDLVWHPTEKDVFASCAADGIYMWRLGKSQPFGRLKCKGYPTAIQYNRAGSKIAYMTPLGLFVGLVGGNIALHVSGATTLPKPGLTWSWDGQWLACCLDQQPKLWGFNDQAPLTAQPQTLFGEIAASQFVQFHDYDPLLAIGDEDGVVCVWRTDRRERLTPVASIRASSAISALSWNPLSHQLAIGYSSGMVRLWQHPFGTPTNGELACVST